MILLIDAGNTRIKWGVAAHGKWLAEGALLHAEVGGLRDVGLAYPQLTHVLGANVAGAALAQDIATSLRGLAPAVEWLQPAEECCDVRNRYDDPAALGADRWAALIGARAHHAGACLVVTAGTATTIDLLGADGVFQGGLILPGEALMRLALAGNTAQLPLAEGRLSATPRNTADAIVSGCLQAQAGAIERMFRQLDVCSDARCLLNGGAAPRIEPLLTIPFQRIDNLVLKGLAVVAANAGIS